MATLRELVVTLGIEVDDKQFKTAEKAIENVKTNLFAIGAAVAGASAAIFGLAKSTADYAAFLQDTALAVGISTDSLQKLGYAATQSGSSAQEFADSMRFLSRAVIAAKEPGSEAEKNFKKLGVSIRGANGQIRSTDEIFVSLADGFKKLPPGAEKTGLAMEFLGRSGSNLVQTLNNGSEGLKAFGDELVGVGGVVSESDIIMGNDFQASLDKIHATFMAVVRTIGFKLIPIVKDVVDNIQQFIVANRELINSTIEDFFKALVFTLASFFKIIKLVIAGVTQLTKAFNWLLQPIGGVIGALKLAAIGFGLYTMGTLVKGVMAAVAAFRTFGTVALVAQLKALAIPIAIGAAIAGVILLVEDLYAFFQGRPSVLGYVLKNKDEILAQLLTFLKFVGNGIWKIGAWIAEALKSAISNFISWALTAIGDFFKTIFQGINGVVKAMTGVDLGKTAGQVGGFLASAGGKASDFLGLSKTVPTPSSAIANTASTTSSNTNVSAPITINVPPGMDANAVGMSVKDMLEQTFRETARSSSTVVER